MRLVFAGIILALIFALFGPGVALAQDLPDADLTTSNVTRLALLLTLLAVLPALLISITSFTRIVIVLGMVRHAFGMPETPPTPVLISLALFLSVFVMAPTLQDLNETSLQPWLSDEITMEDAIGSAEIPVRNFMLSQVSDNELRTMYEISDEPLPERPEDVHLQVLVPAFILNELRLAFTIGFVILLPFLLIDLVVSSVLLSLGMMMVPPATISLPIKLLLFVVIDGWTLVISGLIGGFA